MSALNEHRIRQLPIWRGAVKIETLKGGLSNASYVVTDDAGRHVARFGEDYPFHHVSRARELMVARAASEAGFGPEVEHAQPGLVVSRFIDARTFDAADVRANPGKIAELLRQFHRTMPNSVSGEAYMFWVFHVIRDYARILKAGGSRMTDELPAYLALSEELEAAQVPLPIVFAHNDLLPANFMDDGERLWLIDYEYAGYSTAMFDLAGVAANAEMDDVESASLLESYFSEPPTPKLLRAHAAMQCAALLREAMWSMVSELYLKAPGADYEAYTAENLKRLNARVASYRSRFPQ